MSLRIVRAGPGDAFIVAALSLQFAIATDGSREDGYLDRAAEHWVRHRAQLPTWFAERDGAHAGLLQASSPPPTTWPGVPDAARSELWIRSVFVSPGHRGAGVGAALLSACEVWAQGAGIGVIRLRSEAGAEQFYDRAGYAPAREVLEKRLHPPSP
ncbi:GNAT family N-acetyltransferase [Janibacter alittae]|uniref:GNAT family N-acetyltransferase n=1 Tax=Janibacter alittae TaxID=3115209 RepID=A0ABZ2MI59_9MICO